MSHILNFPTFTPLEITHRKLLEDITQHFPSYSDFNFISLFTWDVHAAIAVAYLHGNLVVRFSDYITGDIFFSFIGTSKLAPTIDTLCGYAREHKITDTLQLIPQSVVDKLPLAVLKNYEVTESRDNHDYILSATKLAELGEGFKRKRKAVARFTRAHGGELSHGLLDLAKAEARQQITDVMDLWKKHRHKTTAETKSEFAAIQRALDHAKALDLKAYGIFISGRLTAFTLFEVAPGRTAVFHYSKMDNQVEGISEYLKNVLAKYLQTIDVEFINIEQDLGVEGMRQAKIAYHPIHFLKKYAIAPKKPAVL